MRFRCSTHSPSPSHCHRKFLRWTVVLVVLSSEGISSFSPIPIPAVLMELKRSIYPSSSSPSVSASVSLSSALDSASTSPSRSLDPASADADRSSRSHGLEELGIHLPVGLLSHISSTNLVSNMNVNVVRGGNAGNTTASPSIRKRIWIVDNSGSMALQDGHSVLVNIDKSVECSRWAEAQETVQCHAELASRLHTPTEFRLLNPKTSEATSVIHNILGRKSASRWQVGSSHSRRNQQKDTQRIQRMLSQQEPKGITPLPRAISEVRDHILQLLPELQESNSRVVVIIATDGSNYEKDTLGDHVDENGRQRELRAALESLDGLPVQLVIRLCTDYEPLVDFYNDLDATLESVPLDVIDDYSNEADQVFLHNPWLNYALPLHRLREMGQVSDLWDRLDEHPFSQREIKDFCELMFGVNLAPAAENTSGDSQWWTGFCDAVESWQSHEHLQLHPKDRVMKPWIDTSLLRTLG